MNTSSISLPSPAVRAARNLNLNPYSELGRVTKLSGFVLEGTAPGVRVGSVVELETDAGWISGEVIGFRDDRVLMAPVGETIGLAPGALVRPTSKVATLAVGPALLGRTVDPFGNPLDGYGPIATVGSTTIHKAPPPVSHRARINQRMETGIKVIDALLPSGRGQRVGLFAGAGVGKTMLIRQIARNAAVDVVVMGLIGERGCEVRDLIDVPGVRVVATSDRSPMERIRGALAATAVAEWFRAQGKHVLLVIDSLTRYAMALREVGLAAGEPPATKGYPPSVFARLPQLLERACPLESGGSITGFYSVLVEGDDLSDPVADSARSLLDGHIILSRDVAARGHFPAVDVLASASRVALAVSEPIEIDRAQRTREVLSLRREAEELQALGAYTAGTRPDYDRAIMSGLQIDAWSKQGHLDKAGLGQSANELHQILTHGGWA